MNQEIYTNPSMLNLYSFLTKCVIEQRGSHTLNGIDPNARDGTDHDIELINKFIELELKSDTIDKNSKVFLETLSSNVKNNLKVHLTRDCQIIETGNHIVNLTFSSKKDNFIYNLTFSSKFKQKFGLLPIDSNKIDISYFRDVIINNKEGECLDYDYIIIRGKTTECYRKVFKSKQVNSDDEIITLLPCDYLFYKKELEPKLQPDACIIN